MTAITATNQLTPQWIVERDSAKSTVGWPVDASRIALKLRVSWASMARRIRARRSHLRRQRLDLCARVVRGLFRALSIDAQDRERSSRGPAPRVQEHCPARNRKSSG